MNDKPSAAKQIRGTLNDIFKEALYTDIIKLTCISKQNQIKIQRAGLSLDGFNTILSLINDDHHWLSQAMKLASDYRAKV
ncbi:MAG: hypothetical protein ACL7AY_13775 [Candidatus Arsenophonus phytopathogenicus]